MNRPASCAAEPATQLTRQHSSTIAQCLFIAALLAMVGFTLVVSAPSVRFQMAAPDLVSLPSGAPAPTDPSLPARGHLIYQPVAEGLLLRVDGKRGGRLRWEHPASAQYDRLRITGAVTVTGIAPEIRPGQQARLLVIQPGEHRTISRLVEQWPTAVTDGRFDRIIKVPDPTLPLWITLAITSRSGQMVLHRLMVDGLAPRASVQGARWALLTVWIGLILGVLQHLARPMAQPLRVSLWATLASLLVGILAPPELLGAIKEFVAALLPFTPSITDGPDLNVYGHFTLFAALATLLLHGRPDLGWVKLVGLLAALAMVTELMQLLTDGRTADWIDTAVDLAGVGSAVLVVGFVKRVCRLSPSRL